MFKANYKPNSAADISGGENYPGIRGRVIFRQQKNGVLVTADIYGLPTEKQDVIPVFSAFIYTRAKTAEAMDRNRFQTLRDTIIRGIVRIRTMREICRLYLKTTGMRICHF